MSLECPTLRDDLQFSRGLEGEAQTTIYDPVLNRYHQVGAVHERILKKLDGRRTLETVVAEVGVELDAELPIEVLREVVSQARATFLLDTTSAARFSKEEGQRVWRLVRRELARSGVVLRSAGAGSAPTAERRARPDVAQLFEQAVAQLRRGNPVQAARHLGAVLEAAPDNARAAWLLKVTRRCALLARPPGQSKLITRVPLFNPDRLLAWAVKRLGSLVSPGFYGLLVAWFALGAVLVGANLDRVIYDVSQVPAMVRAHPFLVLGGYIWFPFIALGHEFCHGLACKKWGGRVPEMGLLVFFFLFPTAYCDTSATYTFRSNRRRIGVSLAGISWQMLLYLPAVVVYLTTRAGAVTHMLALFLLMQCWGTVLSGMIPFVKGDGYFALADALRTPNLFQVSNRFWSTRFQRWFLGLEAAQAETQAGTRPWVIAVYGALNILAMGLLSVTAYVAVTLPMMTTLLGGPGLLLATLPIAFLLGGPVVSLARVLWRRRIEVRRSPRAWASFALAAGVAVFAGTVPVTHTVTVPFEVSDVAAFEFRAGSDGAVATWRVHEGDEVRRGDVLLEVELPEAVLAFAQAQGALQAARAELAELEAGPAPARVQALEQVVAAQRKVEQLQTARADRGESLAADGLLSAARVDASRSLAESARNRVELARADLRAASERPFEVELRLRREAVTARAAEVAAREQALASLRLVAPRDGRVEWSLVPRTEVATSGLRVKKGDLMFKLRPLAPVAQLEVPLEYSELFEEGQHVHLQLEGSLSRPVEGALGPTFTADANSAANLGASTTGFAAALAGTRALVERNVLHLRTAPLTSVSLIAGARGRARVELEPHTLLWRLAWQLRYFAGYYWWALW